MRRPATGPPRGRRPHRRISWHCSARTDARLSSAWFTCYRASRARARGDMSIVSLLDDEQRGCAETVDQERDDRADRRTVEPKTSDASGVSMDDSFDRPERVSSSSERMKPTRERDQQHGEVPRSHRAPAATSSPPARSFSTVLVTPTRALRGALWRRDTAWPDSRSALARRPSRTRREAQAVAPSTRASSLHVRRSNLFEGVPLDRIGAGRHAIKEHADAVDVAAGGGRLS